MQKGTGLLKVMNCVVAPPGLVSGGGWGYGSVNADGTQGLLDVVAGHGSHPKLKGREWRAILPKPIMSMNYHQGPPVE